MSRITGNRIAQARRDKGMTQEQLAEATGIEQSALHRIEKGIRRPTEEEAEALGRELGLSREEMGRFS